MGRIPNPSQAVQTQTFVTERAQAAPGKSEERRPQRAGPPRPREQRAENLHLSARGSASRVTSAASITGSRDIAANWPSLPDPYPFFRIQRQGAQSRAQESATDAPISSLPGQPVAAALDQPAAGGELKHRLFAGARESRRGAEGPGPAWAEKPGVPALTRSLVLSAAWIRSCLVLHCVNVQRLPNYSRLTEHEFGFPSILQVLTVLQGHVDPSSLTWCGTCTSQPPFGRVKS
ncbi:uncharacterized protein LOC122710205 [Cervus elaphus]|uniref:uncharacterized protein LOC122710205 n=1 Tax=Cervus elaphus TaxID=9860 RepID=UPI001CC28FC8|nr:uncharacterized protein LOC122710205 [Cervus elaphus]